VHASTFPRRAIFLGALLFAASVFAEDVSRLQQVTDELATLQTVIQKVPEGRERKKLEERLSFLERERDLLQRRQLLEAQEALIDRRLQDNAGLKLQSTLRALESITKPAPDAMDKKSAAIDQAATQRDSLKADRAKTAQGPGNGDRESRLAAINEQLLTATEQFEALQLQREAIAHKLALGRDIEAISKRFGDEPAEPPLQLRTWWDRRNEYLALSNRLVSAQEIARSVEDRRAAAAEALKLAREKFGQIDDEIALLATQTGLFRSAPGVDRLLTAARRDKEALAARLAFLESQNTALTESGETTVLSTELLGTELNWLRERQSHLTERYLRWLAWPVAVVTLVLLVFAGAGRFLLPRLYKHEMLISARRVNRYFMIAALAIVVAGFFFEDLRVLATTLGIVSAALVIALQDVFASIAGWFAIVISHKVRVGDRVEIDGVKGDVLDIELMRTVLNEIDAGLGMDHPTGRITILPNSFIFRHRVHNTTHNHRWVWIRTDITVTYETPVADAMTVLRKVLEEETAEVFAAARTEAASIENRYGRPDAVYEPKLYCTIADSGVMFSLVTVADYRAKTAMRDRLHWRILAEFARNPQLQFAYPTHRAIFSQELASHPPSGNTTAPASPTPSTSSRLTAWPGSTN